MFGKCSWRKAAGFFLVAVLPLAGWMLRNRFSAGTWAGYVPHMGSQAASLARPGAQFKTVLHDLFNIDSTSGGLPQ